MIEQLQLQHHQLLLLTPDTIGVEPSNNSVKDNNPCNLLHALNLFYSALQWQYNVCQSDSHSRPNVNSSAVLA